MPQYDVTFSPIKVESPLGKTCKSLERAHALITSLYLCLQYSEPNSILSLRVAFRINACCVTNAIELCRNRLKIKNSYWQTNIRHKNLISTAILPDMRNHRPS